MVNTRSVDFVRKQASNKDLTTRGWLIYGYKAKEKN